MILTIDIGNTNIVIGCVDENTNQVVLEERIFTDVKKTAVEYAITIKTLFDIHGISPADISGGIMSSSVPPITKNVKKAAETLLGKNIIEVGPGVKSGIDIKIDDPAQLGPDLLVGAVAGLAEYGAPLIIIDMGTASTITVINGKKQVIGGMIMPGVSVSLEGMSLKAAHLPQIAIEPPTKLIGSNTIDCMKSGVVYGHASCMDGMIERIRENLGVNAPVVATGGLSGVIAPLCKNEIIIDNQLLLKGLQIIYQKNVKLGRREN